MKKSHDDNKRELLEAKKLALEELKEMYELQIEESTKNIDEV